MSLTSLKLTVAGPGRDHVSKEIASFIEREFGQQPAVTGATPVQKQEGAGDKDFLGAAALAVAIASFFISIPGAVLSVRSLAERKEKKEKLDSLIRVAAELREKYPDTDITVDTAKGTVALHSASSVRLLDEFNR